MTPCSALCDSRLSGRHACSCSCCFSFEHRSDRGRSDSGLLTLPLVDSQARPVSSGAGPGVSRSTHADSLLTYMEAEFRLRELALLMCRARAPHLLSTAMLISRRAIPCGSGLPARYTSEKRYQLFRVSARLHSVTCPSSCVYSIRVVVSNVMIAPGFTSQQPARCRADPDTRRSVRAGTAFPLRLLIHPLWCQQDGGVSELASH